MKVDSPIGIFDSGVGGLSIANDICALLPNENIIYVADQAFAPYGEQPKEVIQSRSLKIVKFLIEQGCKAIVVACNTATVHAIELIRQTYDVPIIGVEPGIKPAVLNTHTGIIGVLATTQTINSPSFKNLILRFASDAKVCVQPSPRLVELVESNDLNSPEALNAVSEYVEPLLSLGCDQIALGCTHYAFLEPLISSVVDGRAKIINTASPVAAQLKRRLQEKELLQADVSSRKEHSSTQPYKSTSIYSSSATEKNTQLISHLISQGPSSMRNEISNVQQLDL